MNKIFLDTDVAIDYLTRRDPFSTESVQIFEYSFRNQLQIYVSSLSFWNIYYIIGKLESKRKAKEKIRLLFQLVILLPVGAEIVEKAIWSEFKDFEDAIQNFCAVESKLSTLITRNVRDYSQSKLSILTPKEFLATFE